MKNSLLQRLYEQYYNEIYLYLYSLSKSEDVAEDLTQETFLKAILSLADDHVNVRAWLYMVARNLYFNYYHRERKNSSVTYEELENEVISNDSTAQVIERIIHNDSRRLLYLAMQHLEQRKREILIMQYFGGMSQREIAVLLRLSQENIRVLSYRARQEIKKYMEENGYEI